MDTLDMLEMDMDMDTLMPTTDYTMASVLLMLSLRPRLMLILTFSMEVMDILVMPDTMDTPMPTMDIMASVLLMPSPRLMLTPTFSMEDMDILDMLDTMDIPMVDMPTGDKLQQPKQYPATENGQTNHQCLLLQ